MFFVASHSRRQWERAKHAFSSSDREQMYHSTGRSAEYKGLNLLFFEHATPSPATGPRGSLGPSYQLSADSHGVVNVLLSLVQVIDRPFGRFLAPGSLLVDCSSSRKRSGSYPRKEDQPTNLLIVLSNSFSLSVRWCLLTIAHCRGSKILQAQ